MQEAEIGPVDMLRLVQGYLNVASSIFEQLKTSSSEDSLLVSLKARVGNSKAVRDSSSCSEAPHLAPTSI